MVLTLYFIFLSFFVGCDTIPLKNNHKIVNERNNVIESARDDFRSCFLYQVPSEVHFEFKLYRAERAFFKRPTAFILLMI